MVSTGCRIPLYFPDPLSGTSSFIGGTMENLLSNHSHIPSILCIVSAVLAGCLLIPPVSAHAPSDMSVTYDELTKELRVSITHEVPNPGEHHIKEVTITINGNVVKESRYTTQPSADTFSYSYPIETVTTDEIKVIAACSQGGSISRTLYNTGAIASTPLSSAAGQPTPTAASGFLPLLGIAAALLIGKK